MDKRAGDEQPAHVLLHPDLIGEVRRPLLAVCDFLNVFRRAESDVLHASLNSGICVLKRHGHELGTSPRQVLRLWGVDNGNKWFAIA